jgi:transposase
MKQLVIGMDIAKTVFQLHTVEASGEVKRVKLRREEVMPFFTQFEPAVVAMEACGSAHEWGRKLSALGHQVKLLAPRSVRPFVLRNKTDAADAKAIWTAVQQPEARIVALKTEHQQTVLALHRMRGQLMKFRIMQTNALRGILYEFGIVLPAGYPAFAKAWAGALAAASERLPAMLIVSLQEQWTRVQSLDKEMAAIERRLTDSLRKTEQCKRLIDIPGVGLLTATAAVATIGNPATFKSGREFASLGLCCQGPRCGSDR